MNQQLIPLAESSLAQPAWLTVHQEQGELLGVSIDPTTSFDDWAVYAASMLRFCRGMQWVIGDLLLGGERLYGEAYSQILDAADYDAETLRSCAWVAGRFDSVRRRTAVSWSHHREVAALEPAEADRLLERSRSEGLSSRDLRLAVRQIREAKEQAQPLLPLPFDEQAEAASVETWLRKRLEAWPVPNRAHLAATLRRFADSLENQP